MNETLPPAPPFKAAWDSWITQLRSIGGSNPLLNFELDNFCQIDLERAHPSGLAQFVSTGAALLNNLIRDPLAFSRAFTAAKRIDAKAHQLGEHFGIESVFLVGGLVSFEGDGFDLNLPILLWPSNLIRKGDDYELRRVGEAQVNPALITSLEICYGVRLDPAQLLAQLNDDGDLVPISMLNYLSEKVTATGSLDLKRILALGNFTTTPTELLADIETANIPLLKKLTEEPVGLMSEPDGIDVLTVAEADSTQQRIVARALAGQSFAVETLPGCGYTQTVVNLLANLASADKKVLVLAPRRQTLNELADRFAQLGLNGLLVRSHSSWMDVIAAISRHEKVREPKPTLTKSELKAAHTELQRYFESLSEVHPQLGVSLADVLNKLSELSAMPHPPVTNARISREPLLNNPNRDPAFLLLMKAYELGEFRYGPQDSAWFQARFDSPEEAVNAIDVARRLRDQTFPSLAKKLQEFISDVEFEPANSVAEMGDYLRLFAGIRESLDRFSPAAYDRALTDVIIATSPRKEKGEMSGGTRRKLKKLAKELIRPGMHVSDLNSSLKAIDQQRKDWALYSTSLKPPTVPNGINDALVTYQVLVADLDSIQQHLDPKNDEPPLVELSLAQLTLKLNSLVEDIGALDNLGERAMVAKELRELGLEDLMRDLARQHASREHIGTEFDLAWCQSALEYIAEINPELIAQSTSGLAELEAKFADLNQSLLVENRLELANQLSVQWKKGLLDKFEQAEALRAQLKTGGASLRKVFEVAPELIYSLSGCVAMSPYQVAQQVPQGVNFDVLVILDGAGSSVAENLSGFKRANQVIVFGDDAIGVPSGFEVEARPVSTVPEATAPSVLTDVANAFGQETLRVSYRPEGQVLGDFINREFYQNRILFEPTVDDYFGDSHFQFEEITENNRANSNIGGANESLDAEVDRTVQLIYNHAQWHPEESLLVATASAAHADRIRNAVYNGLNTRSRLVEFFEGHGRERFEIATMSQLAHRIADRVIFSVGFGRTPQGAMLMTLGQLSSWDGRRALANLLVSARKQFTLVSCFGADDLGEQAIGGVAQLRDLMLTVGNIDKSESTETLALLEDLSIRLRKLGVTVKLDYQERINLAASYSNKAISLEPDWNLSGQDLVQNLVFRPALLRSHGWMVERAYALQLFIDPEKYAKKLAQKLGILVYDKVQSMFDDETAFEDTDQAWGDLPALDSDQRLKQDKPPHWQ